MSKGKPAKSESKSGYAALSDPLKKAFDPFGQAINQYTLPSNPGVTEAFTPQGVNADEEQAFAAIRGGFAPTAESLIGDIGMQMNPFNSSVIDEINRQHGGEYSLMKEALSGSGGLGSNRQFLGANDVDLSRTNQIGGFLQNQFNTSLQNALTTIPGLRQQDAEAQAGIGGFLRNLDLQTKQAPVTALQTGTGMIAPFVSGGTSSSTGATPGIGATLGGIGNLAFGAGTLFPGLRPGA